MLPIVALALAAVLAAGAVAQDAPAADTRPVNVLADSGPLVKAVKAALGGQSRFTGKVEVKKPEGDGDEMMGMVFGGPPGGGGEEFAGEVEVLRTDKGESIVASTTALPVLAAYDDGKAMSVHAHYAAGKPPSAARFTKMLLPLLRGDALAKAVEKATWTTEAGEGGATVYVGKLPKSLVEKPEPEGMTMGGGMMMMGGGSPKVVDVAARFVVGKDGKLAGASIALTRNDPAAAMRKLIESKREESDGEGGIAISPDDFENLEDVEGDTITFALTRGDDAPSKRAARLLALFRAAGAE